MTKGGVGRQGFWYLFAGVSAALLELGLFQLLYTVFGMNVLWANAPATIIATGYNFLVNRNVTFKSSSNPVRSAILYMLLFFANVSVSTFAISAMVQAGVHSAIAKVIMQICVAGWNFILYRKVVFR